METTNLSMPVPQIGMVSLLPYSIDQTVTMTIKIKGKTSYLTR